MKNIRARAIKEGIISPKACINDENPSSRNGNKNFEAAIRVPPDNILEEHLGEILKDYKFLEDVPWKTRKEEANKPIYLVRYE